MGFLLFLLGYIIGGATLIPALLVGFYFSFSFQIPEQRDELKEEGDDESQALKANDEKTLHKLRHEPDVAAGYFAVTREFVPAGINGKPPERASQVGTTAKAEDSSPSMYQTM